jgi:hypothetical protein
MNETTVMGLAAAVAFFGVFFAVRSQYGKPASLEVFREQLLVLYAPLHRLLSPRIRRSGKLTHGEALPEVERIIGEAYPLVSEYLFDCFNEFKENPTDVGLAKFCIVVDANFNYCRKAIGYPYYTPRGAWRHLEPAAKRDFRMPFLFAFSLLVWFVLITAVLLYVCSRLASALDSGLAEGLLYGASPFIAFILSYMIVRASGGARQ